jgi:hypothetical protein
MTSLRLYQCTTCLPTAATSTPMPLAHEHLGNERAACCRCYSHGIWSNRSVGCQGRSALRQAVCAIQSLADWLPSPSLAYREVFLPLTAPVLSGELCPYQPPTPDKRAR